MMDDPTRVMDSLDTTDPNAGVQADSVAVGGAEALLAAVTAERDQLAAEKAELHDRLLRRAAEFENFRRRVERERAEIIAFAGMETIRELLPALDDLERALKVECADKEYARGMELIYQRLSEGLKKIGLDAIATQGQKFDPHLHHAVETVASGELEDYTILEEYQRGYNFRGRLLRPAMVKVAVKP
jgi:molecular chaperone GrpE